MDSLRRMLCTLFPRTLSHRMSRVCKGLSSHLPGLLLSDGGTRAGRNLLVHEPQNLRDALPQKHAHLADVKVNVVLRLMRDE